MFERSKQGAVDLIHGSDPLNVEHVEKLALVLEQCIGRGQPRVVLDLEQVPLIDSAGLELLLHMQQRIQNQGGALKLAVQNPLCKEILSVTGVGRHFEIYPEATSAIGSFVQ